MSRSIFIEHPIFTSFPIFITHTFFFLRLIIGQDTGLMYHLSKDQIKRIDIFDKDEYDELIIGSSLEWLFNNRVYCKQFVELVSR